MFHFLRFVLFVPAMGQWSWLCRTKAEPKLPSFLGMFPGGHPWHVILKPIRWWISWMLPTSSIHDLLMIYRWYPDVSVTNFDKIWREITEINIFGLTFADVRDGNFDLQDIHCQGRKAPAPRGKPRLHRPPATETCLELGQTRFKAALSTWICLKKYG